MTRDAQGHHLTGADATAASHYDAGLQALAEFHGDPVAAFGAATACCPGFVMAHLARAWVMALSTDPAFLPLAHESLTAAAMLPATDREASHRALLKLVLTGELSRAAQAFNVHVTAWPRDLLAIEMGLIVDLLHGNSENLRDRPAQALPHWSADLPGHASLTAWHAFGLEETGAYDHAESLARAAAERAPHDYFAHHTVAHVMEMQGRAEQGLAWMDSRRPFWSAPGHLARGHVWWHQALFHLDLDQTDAALSVYDHHILGEMGPPAALSLTNASALLWRVGLLGGDVTSRARTLAYLWTGHADGATSPYNELHAAMAELQAGDDIALDRRRAAMREAASGAGETASCLRELALPLVDGFAAFHRGRNAEAAAILHPVRAASRRLGGSHAQRDIIDWTLTEAALRAGLKDLARSLARDRLDRKPASHPVQAAWRRANAA
jgi:hypothetical protein